MSHDEKMLDKAKRNLERIRREYSGDLLKFYEPSAIHLVKVYEKKVQEGRRPSKRPKYSAQRRPYHIFKGVDQIEVTP